MTTRAEPQLMINYIAPDEEWQDEYATLPPMVGYGIQSPSMWKRYRIVDVWIMAEKRAALDYGIHAFLEPVAYDDDRPANEYPQYYRP